MVKAGTTGAQTLTWTANAALLLGFGGSDTVLGNDGFDAADDLRRRHGPAPAAASRVSGSER